MVDFTTIKEVISPKTLNKFTFALVVLWTVLGAILCGAFLELKINEPRYDFRCDGTGETRNIDYIRGECFHQYWIQNHRHGIPPYAFILLNVALIPIVTCIYSLCVKSTVYKLERRHQDEETEPRDKRRTLFIAYVCQLVVNIALETTFFALLETHLFFPENFPSNFSCTVKNLSVNCNTTRAGEKNVWITLAEVINGFFAFCAFVEIIWILSRARNSKKFMENPHFYFHHLESKAQEVRQNQPEATPLVIVETLNQTINTPHYAVPVHRKNNDTTMSPQQEEMALGEPPHRAINTSDYVERRENTEITVSSEHLKDAQAQMDFQSAIQTLKENCLQGTQQPSDLVQPFQRPNPGEGHVHDLTMDEIYVHVAIHKRES